MRKLIVLSLMFIFLQTLAGQSYSNITGIYDVGSQCSYSCSRTDFYFNYTVQNFTCPRWGSREAFLWSQYGNLYITFQSSTYNSKIFNYENITTQLFQNGQSYSIQLSSNLALVLTDCKNSSSSLCFGYTNSKAFVVSKFWQNGNGSWTEINGCSFIIKKSTFQKKKGSVKRGSISAVFIQQ